MKILSETWIPDGYLRARGNTACIHSASYHIMKAVKIMLLGVFVHPQTHGWLVGLVSEITRVFNKTKNNECVKSEKAMVTCN